MVGAVDDLLLFAGDITTRLGTIVKLRPDAHLRVGKVLLITM